MKRILVCIVIGASLTIYNAISQSVAFDPMLDPTCKILPEDASEKWNTTYMWYPGQLSSHMQKKMKQLSEARCVYVGYPGKFNQPLNCSYFRKDVRLNRETTIRWVGSEFIQCSVNGQKLDAGLSTYTLPKGAATLLFEVRSKDRLPCLMVDGENVAPMNGWKVSTDNVKWSAPEYYSQYNIPGKLPDSKQEREVKISPYEYIPLINTAIKENEVTIGKNGSVIVDFRHLEVGAVKMHVIGTGELSFSVGETPEEVLNQNVKDYEQKVIEPCKLTGIQQEITLPERALRYMKINSNDNCIIQNIHFDAILWPVNYLMEFTSNDENLNNIWKAGVATLHTSMHYFYLDGVKRDYLPWSMDAVISALAGDYLFGDEQVSRNGLSIALTPPDPQTTDFGIIDYPLHALIGFKHDYLRYGKPETSLLYKERILQMLDLYESIQDENGFVSSKYGTSGFIPGWATKEGPAGQGIPTYGQIMLYNNFLNASYFCNLWKEKARAKKYDNMAKELKKNIMKHFWDEGRKAFINGYKPDGSKDERISHHAQYWAILADIFPEEHYDHLFDVTLPRIPFYKEDISYEKGYEFLAYIKAGRLSDAYFFLNEIWGDWLKQGHTRFPENFSPLKPRKEQLVFYDRPFGLSLCHGGNGVPPVLIVLHGILGFSQSDNPVSGYTLRPQLLHLEWAKGKIPVKEGFITVNLKKEGISTVDVPPNSTVRIQLSGGRKPLVLSKAGLYEFVL